MVRWSSCASAGAAGAAVCSFHQALMGRTQGRDVRRTSPRKVLRKPRRYVESIPRCPEAGPIHAILAHSFGATATMLALGKASPWTSCIRRLMESAASDYLGAKLQLPEAVLQNVKCMFEKVQPNHQA